jgi:opacity protein-like surface antigen
MKTLRLLSVLMLMVFLMPETGFSQYTTKRVRSKYQQYTDSLKNVEYNYVFPILGQGAYKEGFDIPYPIGFMLNYFWADQGILIQNLQLGYQNAYNEGNSFDLRPIVDENGEEILKFGENRNVSYSLNVRPDLWLFPFLNVYGIFGWGQSHTEVNIVGLGNAPFNMTSEVDQGIRTTGFGILAAGGIGPFWVTADFNLTWNKPELLDKATRANVIGLRMGKAFVFKNRPYSNVAFWIGAMRIEMQSETIGEVPMNQAIPQEVWDNKDATVKQYWDWYNNDATAIQQKIADKTLTPIINELDKRKGESIIQYGIDKQVAEKWNMLLGAQYQLNKRWQLRFEAGILGDRKSFLTSLNYRILGFKKKSLSD